MKPILTFLFLIIGINAYSQSPLQVQKDSLINSTRLSCVYDNQGVYGFVTFTQIDTGSVIRDSTKARITVSKGGGQIDTFLVSTKDLISQVTDTIATSKGQYYSSGSTIVSKRTYLINYYRPQKVIIYLENLEAVTNRKVWITFQGLNIKTN